MLDKLGAPFHRCCLLSAPLGSGASTLIRYLAKQFGRDAVIVDPQQLETAEDIKKLEFKVGQTFRLLKGQAQPQYVVENVEQLNPRLLGLLGRLRPDKPLIFTTTEPFGQGMRFLRNSCLFIQLKPSLSKC